jgi:hypothetical protein
MRSCSLMDWNRVEDDENININSRCVWSIVENGKSCSRCLAYFASFRSVTFNSRFASDDPEINHGSKFRSLVGAAKFVLY